MLQLADIVLHDRIVIHIMVHCRGDQTLACTRHHRRCEHVVCNSICDLADHVCCSRCNQHQIRLFRKRHRLHRELKIPVERVNQTLVRRQRLKRRRCDKIRGILRHQNMYVAPKLLQHARYIRHLISGNSSRHTKEYGFPAQKSPWLFALLIHFFLLLSFTYPMIRC